MIEITTDYSDGLKQDFINLNKHWIEKYFHLEDCDIETFRHVDDISAHGGRIFFAVDKGSGKTAGCVALINKGSEGYELAKLAVSEEFQGQGIGDLLVGELLRHVRKIGARRVFLIGNTKLKASINLYKKHGFREIPIAGNSYERCDIMMEKTFCIRKIQPHDQNVVAQIVRNAFIEFSAPLKNTVYDDSRTFTIYDTVNNSVSDYYVYIEDDVLLGGCGFYPTEGLPNGYAEVIKFYLRQEFRGKGIGGILLNTIINASKSKGYSHLYIESFPEFSSAVAMYQKYGFRTIPHRLGNSGHTATSIFMVKELTSLSNKQL
jgi:GNAT superfamily N-acetyltransferase